MPVCCTWQTVYGLFSWIRMQTILKNLKPLVLPLAQNAQSVKIVDMLIMHAS